MTQDTKDILLTLIAAIGDGSIISNNTDYYDMVAAISPETDVTKN